MHMDLTGSEGVFSVPAEHLPGLIWLVAAPITVWVVGAMILIDGAFAPVGRGRSGCKLRVQSWSRVSEFGVGVCASTVTQVSSKMTAKGNRIVPSVRY